MRIPLPLIAVLVLAGHLAGCSTMRPPSVTVLGADIGESTDEATLIEVRVQLENPNDEELELLEYAYRVSVDGGPAYEGRRAGMATIGPRSTTEAVLPAVIRVADLSAAERWSIAGTVQYLTPGALAEILFDTGMRRPKAGFSKRGTLRAAGPAD